MTDEKSQDNEARIKAHRRKRNATAALGAGILVLALAGFCFIMFFAVKAGVAYIKNFVGLEEDEAYFEKYLEPGVMFGPKPFNDISEADQEWEIETAIWASLDENEKNGAYASTADGREILPLKDVEANLKKYFGIVNPKFMSFSNGDFTYEYNRKGQCYYIPLIAVTSYYIPDVKNISRSFNSVTLTVDYKEGQNWGQEDDTASSKKATEKTVKIVLSRTRGNYRVKSIQEVG